MSTEIQKSDIFNCMVGLDFDLLKTNLNAAFVKGQNGYSLLVAPTKTEATEGVTFKEMLAEFKTAFGMKESDSTSINDSFSSLNDSAGGDSDKAIKIDELTFKLNQAFMYMIKESGKDMVCEFALAITVDAQNALPDMGFFRIKSLSLAFWNTTRVNVLAKMGMGNLSNLLG
ncbi:MAG: hypothetical protein LBC86_05230 [Oscillospiraceae bacterium]|nr:hypothetical protein [Oscillospiraceae bacterium]